MAFWMAAVSKCVAVTFGSVVVGKNYFWVGGAVGTGHLRVGSVARESEEKSEDEA